MSITDINQGKTGNKAASTAPKHQPVKQAHDRFIRMKDVVTRVGLSKSRVYGLIKQSKFPSAIKIGAASLWSEQAVNAWMDERKAGIEL